MWGRPMPRRTSVPMTRLSRRSIRVGSMNGRAGSLTGAFPGQADRMSDGGRGSGLPRCRIDRMRTASHTAELVALCRAFESSRSGATRLFVDPLAPAFLIEDVGTREYRERFLQP